MLPCRFRLFFSFKGTVLLSSAFKAVCLCVLHGNSLTAVARHARSGPRIGGRHRVAALKLELSKSTTDETPMCSHVLRTQEELPAKPGSGSEGSSIVESMSIASMHSSTGLLCTSLMPVINNVLGRALKAGRHPHHHDRTRPLHRPWNELLCRPDGKMTSRQPPK